MFLSEAFMPCHCHFNASRSVEFSVKDSWHQGIKINRKSQEKEELNLRQGNFNLTYIIDMETHQHEPFLTKVPRYKS